MPQRRYDLLALDLDGTLLGPDGRVSEGNRRAVARARDEGLEIVICTGRGLIESNHIIDEIDGRRPARGRDVAPVVCAGGAMLCDAISGRTLHRWAMDRDLVGRLCTEFARLKRAPLLLKDSQAAGFDYLVVCTGPLEPPTAWWFDVMDVEVRFVETIEADRHPEHTVRVGFAATTEVMLELAGAITERFGRETVTHHFAAVSGTADHGPIGVKDDTVHLLEVFDPQVSKWTAVHRLALEQGIPRERVAAVGDEINDLAMIQGAGLGVAMGNAIAEVKEAAGVTTADHANDGVALTIENILSGEW